MTNKPVQPLFGNERLYRAQLEGRRAEIHAAHADGYVMRFRRMTQRELQADLGWQSYVREMVEALEWLTFCTCNGELSTAGRF